MVVLLLTRIIHILLPYLNNKENKAENILSYLESIKKEAVEKLDIGF
jgi:hypothetical protein